MNPTEILHKLKGCFKGIPLREYIQLL